MFASSTKAQGNIAASFLEIVWSGLEHLYQEVKRIEQERAQGLGLTEESAQNFSYCSFGSEEGDSMICNYFLWTQTPCITSLALREGILTFRESKARISAANQMATQGGGAYVVGVPAR